MRSGKEDDISYGVIALENGDSVDFRELIKFFLAIIIDFIKRTNQ